MLARSKLNSIESKISEALKNNEICHEDFITIIDEEKKLSRIKRKYQSDEQSSYFVAERFIRTLKSKIYKHMTAASKNVCTDKLDHIVNEYKNTCHRTIKVKPVDVKGNGEVNGEVGDLVR